MQKETQFFHYGHVRRPYGVTQGDNSASKKSIGNEPKIHLCGVIPNKLKHGGFGHRPSPLESFCPCVRVFCVSWSLQDCSCVRVLLDHEVNLPGRVFVLSPSQALPP